MCRYRRKLTVRITELETEVEQCKGRASRFEKEKNKLTIEINEIVIQLESVSINNSYNDNNNTFIDSSIVYSPGHLF